MHVQFTTEPRQNYDFYIFSYNEFIFTILLFMASEQIIITDNDLIN